MKPVSDVSNGEERAVASECGGGKPFGRQDGLIRV
jgi:hypothetical protein